MSDIDVTCFCPYHGRNWLLFEAVEAFRRQRLGSVRAELLILNDCPEQRITCSVPGVRVVNMPQTYRTLSEKWNAGVEMSRGRLIASWDDDDVSMPDRVACSVAAIGDAPMYVNLWVWSMCHERGVIDQIGRAWLCNGMFRRDAFLAAGGNDADDWNDRSTFGKLKDGAVWQRDADPSQIHYVYRWAGEMHDSGHTDTAEVRVKRFRDAVLSDARFAHGEHDVIPWWAMDYEAAVDDAKRRNVRVAKE